MIINKLTKNRQLLVNFVNQANVPLSTKEICDHFSRDMDQATIYRGLTYLEANQYIEGFSFSCLLEGTMKYYYGIKEKHPHFLHCKKCHHFIFIENCDQNRLKEMEGQQGVQIDSHVNYYIGTCKECLED